MLDYVGLVFFSLDVNERLFFVAVLCRVKDLEEVFALDGNVWHLQPWLLVQDSEVLRPDYVWICRHEEVGVVAHDRVLECFWIQVDLAVVGRIIGPEEWTGRAGRLSRYEVLLYEIVAVLLSQDLAPLKHLVTPEHAVLPLSFYVVGDELLPEITVLGYAVVAEPFLCHG